LGDFNANIGREDIFNPISGNESSHEISNNNGVRILNFKTSKTQLSKAPCSLIAAFINTPGSLLMDRRATTLITFSLVEDDIQVYLMSDLPEGLIAILTTIW
jgi:hypothetical protein